MKCIKIVSALCIMMLFSSCSQKTDKRKDPLNNDLLEVVDFSEDEKDLILKDKLIVIDPGHGLNNNSAYELISPLSNEKKPANVSGTAGKKNTEEQLNLIVAYKIYQKLRELGAEVIMTRYTNKSYLTNIERAELANDLDADFCIKIHADGSSDKNMSGVSVLVPSGELLVNQNIRKKSSELGELVLDGVIKQTNAKNNGISERSDMTGFNWSRVPVILLEMGYMTNDAEDEMLSRDDYRQKIANGVCDGILEYYKNGKDKRFCIH